MHQTLLQFPNIHLPTRDAHKLRGYFAQLFGAESDLFHNHTEAGKVIYRYPLIQYKVVNGTPMIIGLQEGAKLLVERFMRVKEIEIENKVYTLQEKNLKSQEVQVALTDSLQAYEWATHWLPLNQDNHDIYLKLDKAAQTEMLKSILVNNMISFFKTAGFFAEAPIMVHLQLKPPRIAKLKNQPMLAFAGSFICNVSLPDYIGLGKSVARGYGTIIRK